MNLRKLIREGIEGALFEMKLKEFETPLNEIDWADDFADVKGTCLNPAAITKWLNEELERLNSNKESKEKDRKRRGVKDIIVTRGNLEDVIDTDNNFEKFQLQDNLTEKEYILHRLQKLLEY